MSLSNLIRWAAPAAVVGGALWVLFLLGDFLISSDNYQTGTLAHLAASAVDWNMAVIPLLLLLVAALRLRSVSRGEMVGQTAPVR